MKDDHREDAQIGASLETLARHILEKPHRELAALRAAFDRQISSIEARLEATAHQPAIDATVKVIAEAIREHVDRAQQRAETDLAQALGANAMLRKVLDNAQEQLESAQSEVSSLEADRKVIAAQHKEALSEKKKLTAALKQYEQEIEELATERGELQRKLKDAISAKALADTQYQELVAASQKLTDGLSRTLREERPQARITAAAPPSPKRSEPADQKSAAPATTSSKSAPGFTPATPSAKKKPLPFPGPARDAKRVRIRRGVPVSVEGIPGELIDLSLGGAQAVLRQMVKPNQLVRLTVLTAAGQLICRGRIVWVVYEQPGTSLSVYRTGMKFSDVDTKALEDFMRDFAEESAARQSAEIA